MLITKIGFPCKKAVVGFRKTSKRFGNCWRHPQQKYRFAVLVHICGHTIDFGLPVYTFRSELAANWSTIWSVTVHSNANLLFSLTEVGDSLFSLKISSLPIDVKSTLEYFVFICRLDVTNQEWAPATMFT